MIKTLFICAFLTCQLSAILSQVETSFNAKKYETEIRSLLGKLDEPGTNKTNTAFEFVNYHNTMVKEYPGHAGALLELTGSVAKEYDLSYKLEGNVIVSVQLPPLSNSNQNSGADRLWAEGDTTKSEEIFKVIEEMPRFPGCEDMEGTQDQKFHCAQQKMLEYIYANLQYPDEARSAGVQGRVVVRFVIEEDGTITNIACVRGLSHGLNEEAMRVVETMNHMPEKWSPGRQRGIPVRVQFTLPVSFKL